MNDIKIVERFSSSLYILKERISKMKGNSEEIIWNSALETNWKIFPRHQGKQRPEGRGYYYRNGSKGQTGRDHC